MSYTDVLKYFGKQWSQSLRWVRGVQACEQPIYIGSLSLSLHLFGMWQSVRVALCHRYFDTHQTNWTYKIREFSAKMMIEMWMALMRTRRSALMMEHLKNRNLKRFTPITSAGAYVSHIFSPNFDVYICFCLCWRWMRVYVCMPRICLRIFYLRRT